MVMATGSEAEPMLASSPPPFQRPLPGQIMTQRGTMVALLRHWASIEPVESSSSITTGIRLMPLRQALESPVLRRTRYGTGMRGFAFRTYAVRFCGHPLWVELLGLTAYRTIL